MKTTFHEYEAFSEAIREASITMRLTSLEEPRWSLQHADAGPFRLQRGCEGGGSIAEGETLSDGWVFYHQQRHGKTNGQEAGDDEVFAAPPKSEFCLVCHPLHVWHSVFVPKHLLFSSETELGVASSARPQLLKPPPHVTQRFTSLIRRFLDAVESKPQLAKSWVAIEAFQDELLHAVKQLFLTNRNASHRHFARWYRQTKSTLALAMSHSNSSLSISEIARELGTPERTLRTAFYQCYGLSPLEYLRIQRLHQARRILLASHADETTVTKIAFELGFWDLGRFAGAYRQLYGELPSKTLRKKPMH